MDQLTYRILSKFYNNTLYNWEAVQNLVGGNADFYDYTIEEALEVFDRLRTRKMIVSVQLGNAYVITEEGKRLYCQLHTKYNHLILSDVQSHTTQALFAPKVMSGSEKRHMNKEDFFYLLRMRLHAYCEAISNANGPSLLLSAAAAWESHLNKLRQWDSQSQLFGGTFWGYGLNRICDGRNIWEELDVSEIRMIGELNKHHQSYRRLQLLTFQIREKELLVSTFSIDSLTGNIEARLQEPHLLRDFKFAQRKVKGQFTTVEFHFQHLQHPIRFDIETIHKGDCLSSNELSEYYIKGVESFALHYKQSKSSTEVSVRNFLSDFVDGIKALEEQDENAECIRKHRREIHDEACFRNHFVLWLKAKGYDAVAEPEKGRGYIDLKVIDHSIGNKIVEFKGWWNDKKKQVVPQLCSYLTEFEGDGYIFMINNLTTDIIDRYRDLVCQPESSYIEGSWRMVRYKHTAYQYYISTHKTLQGVKNIYHFIFSVFNK